jgi:hypothetical protein
MIGRKSIIGLCMLCALAISAVAAQVPQPLQAAQQRLHAKK